MKTARFRTDQNELLRQAGIRMFVSRSSHAALSRITKFPAQIN